MKLIRTEEAVGHVLCHDMTQIIPGTYKDARFRKGHVVREEDIPVLLSMGKENLYVWEMVPGMVHENDAVERLCALCENENMIRSQVKEGKLELREEAVPGPGPGQEDHPGPQCDHQRPGGQQQLRNRNDEHHHHG